MLYHYAICYIIGRKFFIACGAPTRVRLPFQVGLGLPCYTVIPSRYCIATTSIILLLAIILFTRFRNTSFATSLLSRYMNSLYQQSYMNRRQKQMAKVLLIYMKTRAKGIKKSIKI